MSQTGPPAHPGHGTLPLPMPNSASPLQQQLGQQHPSQQGANDQGHSQQHQLPAPCTTADRQSTAPLLQSQAEQSSQPPPGRKLPSAAPPAATAVPLLQPQAATNCTQSSSATCSDRPADHSHSTGTTTSNMPPEHLSDSITITLPQEHQQASDAPHSRGRVQEGVSGGVSQAASRAQADQGPRDGEAPPEAQLQEVSGAPLSRSQPQALPQVQPPQDVSQSAAHEQAPPLSHAHHPMPQQQPSHVPNPGVFGDEDDPTWSPDSPTPTLHYSPGPIAQCDGRTELGDTELQSAQVHQLCAQCYTHYMSCYTAPAMLALARVKLMLRATRWHCCQELGMLSIALHWQVLLGCFWSEGFYYMHCICSFAAGFCSAAPAGCLQTQHPALNV